MKYCSHCGSQVADEAVLCLHCGCSIASSSSIQITQSTSNVQYTDEESSLAIWAKICGIVSFFFGWFALGITAIVLACVSKDDTGGVMCSSAKVGYVSGIISTILSALVLFVVIPILVVMAI